MSVVLPPLPFADLDGVSVGLLLSVAVAVALPLPVFLTPLPVVVVLGFVSPDEVLLLLLPVAGLFPVLGLPSAVTVA